MPLGRQAAIGEAAVATDTHRWSRVLAPLAALCGSALILAALRDQAPGAARFVLEAIVAAGVALAVYLALRMADRARASSDDLFNSLPEAMFVVLPDGRIAAANSAARERFGSTLIDLFPEQWPALLQKIEEQLSRRSRARIEAIGIRRGGDEFIAIIHAKRLKDSEESALLISLEDGTRRHRAGRRRTLPSRRVLNAQEEERTRVSRDLHDGLGQILAALHFEINWLRTNAERRSVAASDFENSVGLIEKASKKLRGICRGLRPPMLDDLGLMPAIRQLVDEFAEHSSLTINLDIAIDEDRFPLPSDLALCTFRILQEGLTNVVRHAGASAVDVTLARDGDWLVLSVYDNGRGFDMEGLAVAQGFGIEGMRERARLVEGMLELQSVPEQGTRLVFRAPLAAPAKESCQ